MAFAQSLVFLRKAIEAGYRDVAYIKSDDDLEALRNLPEYRKLIAGLENSKSN